MSLAVKAWNYSRKYSSAFRCGETSSFIPDTILVEPSSYCNLKCIACFRQMDVHKHTGLAGRNMTPEVFKTCIDRFSSLRKITFTGYGEPLMNPDLEQMIEYATGKGIIACTVSNGLLWTPQRSERIVRAGLAQVSFSLDAATPETYRKVRVGDFQKALQGIRSFRKSKDQCVMNIYNVLSKANFHETSGIVKLGYELQADGIFFSPVRTEKILPDDSLTLEKCNREELLEALEKGLQADTEQRSNLSEMVETFRSEETPHRPGTDLCYAPWTNLMILTDGSIHVCCNYFGLSDRYRFGNLAEIDLESIWNGEEYRRFRREFVAQGVCDWCWQYPGLDSTKVHDRISRLKKAFPFLRAFSIRDSKRAK